MAEFLKHDKSLIEKPISRYLKSRVRVVDVSEIIPNITSDEIDLEKDGHREDEIKREKPPHHDE